MIIAIQCKLKTKCRTIEEATISGVAIFRLIFKLILQMEILKSI